MILYHLSSENEGTLFNLPKKDEEKFEKRVQQTICIRINKYLIFQKGFFI
jgi:hypothetical protein